MANFVRDGIALDIPEAQLSLLKSCFDKADNDYLRLKDKLEDFSKVVIENQEYLADRRVAEAFNNMSAQLEQSVKNSDGNTLLLEQKDAELASLKVNLDSLTAKAEALELEITTLKAQNSDEAFKNKLAERRSLERLVFPLLDQEEQELIDLSDRQLKEALIIKRYNYSSDALASKSEEAISAIFEVASMEAHKDSSKEKSILPRIESSTKTTYDAAIAEYVAEVENAYKLASNN